jgi:hypothetical protein
MTTYPTVETLIPWLQHQCRNVPATDFDTLWEISRATNYWLDTLPAQEREQVLRVVKQRLDSDAADGQDEKEAFVFLLRLVYDPPQLL